MPICFQSWCCHRVSDYVVCLCCIWLVAKQNSICFCTVTVYNNNNSMFIIHDVVYGDFLHHLPMFHNLCCVGVISSLRKFISCIIIHIGRGSVLWQGGHLPKLPTLPTFLFTGSKRKGRPKNCVAFSGDVI